jgi:hypothetical protein
VVDAGDCVGDDLGFRGYGGRYEDFEDLNSGFDSGMRRGRERGRGRAGPWTAGLLSIIENVQSRYGSLPP